MEEEERYKKAFFYGSVLPFAILVIVGVTEIVMKQTDFPWIMEFVLCFLAVIFYLVIEKTYIKPEWDFVWVLIVAASMFIGGLVTCAVVWFYMQGLYSALNPWSRGAFAGGHWFMYLLTMFAFEMLWLLLRILIGIISLKRYKRKGL